MYHKNRFEIQLSAKAKATKEFAHIIIECDWGAEWNYV